VREGVLTKNRVLEGKDKDSVQQKMQEDYTQKQNTNKKKNCDVNLNILQVNLSLTLRAFDMKMASLVNQIRSQISV
jgi:hypothetical protein